MSREHLPRRFLCCQSHVSPILLLTRALIFPAAKMIQELFRDRLFAKLQQRQRKVRKRTMLEANGILGLFARRHKRKLLWRLGADEVADAARPDGTPKTLAVKDVLSSAFQGVRTQARPIFKMEIHGREPSSPSLIMESLGELNLNIRHLGIILHPEVVSRLLTAVFGTLKSLEPWIAEQIDPAAPAPTEPITALSCLNLVVDGAVIVVPSPAEPDGQLRPGAYVLNLGRFAMKNGFKEAPEEVAPQQEIAEPVLFPAQERSNTIIATMAMQLAPSAILMSPNFRSDTARTTGWILRSNLRSLTPSGLALNLSILKRHTCRPWEMDNYVETLSSTEIVATLAPLALELQLDGTARALKAVDSVMMVLDALPQDEIPFCSPQDQIMKQIIRVHFAPWDGDRLEMHQQVAKDRAISGLHVVLYDGFLPIVEVALSELNVSAELEVLQPSLIGFEIDPVKEPLRGGNASVFVGLRVMAYNEALEAWEPLVEPWTVHLKWSAKCVCGGSIAAPGNVQQTPSTDLVPAVDIKPVIGHAIHLQSTEPLELNVSHAMLVSALQTLTILLTLEEEDQESNQDLVKRHHRGCVHNLTELFIKYEVVSTSNDEPAGRVVAPGELRSFPSPNGSSAPPAPPSSMGTMKPARGNTTHQEMAACSNSFELVDAVKKGDTAMATELLQRTAPVESTDRQGSPVLHLAINRRDEQMVSLLLLWKANVDAPAPISGNRPLHLSASRNSLECTQALLNARANPSATNAKGQVPPRVAIPGSKVQKEIYNAMIEKINAEGRRFSSFKLVNEVVPSADVGQIRELLEQKADPNSTDGHVTALQKVVQLSGEQATTTAAVLIDGGADLEYTKDTNNNGRTALALAAEAGNVVLVQFLLERGASACTLDESFQLPLDLCCHSGATAAQVRKSLREALHDELILAGWLGVESSSTVASPAGSSLLGTSSSSTPRRKSRLSLRRSSSAHAEANTSRTRVQRFCALLPTGWLVCFGDEELTRSFERVPLESMLAVSAVEDDDDNVGFQLDCPGATYAFYCEEFKETRDEWLQTLREESMLLQNSKSDGPLNSAPSRLKENRRKAGRRISLSRALPVPKLQALRRSFVPSQAVQPMLSSANSSRGARQTADEVELRLSVDAQASEVRFANDSSTCARYGPLEHVSMQIGTSLMKMVEQSDPSKSVGVLLSVRARRGVRTLTVASPVLLTNSMAAQLQVNFAQSTATESEISMAPKQTCSIPLFDIQKCGGSWPTCEALKVRPGQDWEGGQLDFFGSAASTASRSSFISDAARKLFQMNSAGTSWLRGGLIMSQRRPVSADDLSSGGNIPSTWFCCVDVTSPDAIISDTWQAERREAALNLIAEHGGQQQEEILPGFRPTKLLEKLLSSQRGLPSADSLLNGWTCSLQDAQSFSGQMTGWIGVTHSECVFFSASRRQSIANAQPISKAWNQLELTRSRDPSLPSFILTISATGQAFEVSGMVNFEATFRILTNLKAAYDAEWKEGPGRWLPRQVAFYAPLTFTNLMPSQLQLTVKRVEANGDHDSAREATFDVTLRPGQSIACTELHALTRLQLTAELASARADEPSLVGSAELHCESILEQVVEEAGSLPDDAAVHSSLMIDLKPKRSGRRLTRQASAFVSLGVNLPVLGSTLKMKASATVRRMGTLSIDFEAPHALQNLTAFSLNLYSPADPSQGAVSERVAQSRAGQVNLSLFSLRGRLDKAQLSIWREESSKGSLRRSATRALADMSDTTKAAAASTIGKFWKSRGGAGFRLSKAFSVVEVGTDRVLQLVGEGGKVHDVAIQIEKLAGKLAASTTVVVVRDAFVLHNLTGMTLQWRSSAGTNLMDADAEMPIYWSKNTSSASNSADANEDGTLDASIDVVTDRRKLCVRVNLGGREWSSWSRPFDAESATSCELKLRSRMLGTEIRHRLQLAVTTERAVRRLSISALAPTVPRPYLVQNSSSCLLAYRQNGTHFWDFLGAHESRAYSWDDAQAKEKQLEVIAWDPVDGLVGQLHHVTIAKPKAIRLPMSEKEAKIDLASPISRIASFSAAAACVIRYGGDSADRAVGWLCMSQDALHLVVARNALGTAEAAKDDRSDAAAEKGEMQLGASAQVDSPTSPLNNAIWAGRSRIMQPIPFSIIENVSLRVASQCISLCLASDDRGVEVKLELGELLDAAETMSKLENMRRAALEGETPAPSSADAMQHTPESRPTASLPATTPARRSSVPFLSPRANSRSSTPRESSAQQASGGPAAGKFRSLMMTPRKRWMKLEAKPRGPLRVLELREDDGSVKATPASRRRRASQEPGSSSMRSLRLQLSPRRSLAGSDAEQHHEQEVDDEEDVVVTEELESEHEVLRTAEQGEEPELLRVVVSLPRIGLSLVDEEPVEVLCASLIGIDATYVMQDLDLDGELEHKVDFTLQRLQVDSALTDTQFKVMLAPDPHGGLTGNQGAPGKLETPRAPGKGFADQQLSPSDLPESPGHLSTSSQGGEGKQPGQKEQEKPCLCIKIGRLHQWANVLCISKATVSLVPLVLQLEQNVLARILRMVDSLAPLLDDLGAVQERLARSQEYVDKEVSVRGSGGDSAAPSGPDASDEQVGIGASELLLQEVKLDNISLNISVVWDAFCAPSFLQPYHPSKMLLHVSEHVSERLSSFAVHGWKLKLPKLNMPEGFETTDSLVLRVVWHYLAPLLRASYRLLLVASPLGAAVQDVKGGTIALVKAPKEAMRKDRSRTANAIAVASSLRKGSVSLAAAVPAFMLDASASVCHSAETFCSAFSLDSKQSSKESLKAQGTPNNTLQGIAQGTTLVYDGAARGVRDIMKVPMERAKRSKSRTGKAIGFSTGIVKGVAGLVGAPTAAAFGAAAKTCEGLSSDLRRHTHEGQQRDARRKMLRVRQPRKMGHKSVLRTYPRLDASLEHGDHTHSWVESTMTREEESHMLLIQELPELVSGGKQTKAR